VSGTAYRPAMRMNRTGVFVLGLLIATASQLACSSDGDTTGTGGSSGAAGNTGGGGSTGAAGAAGGSGGHAGGGGGAPAAFMALMPCEAEADYETGTTIAFPAGGGFAYAPKCLKVTAGTTVTFSGDFSSHPLMPSTRGGSSANPITSKSSGSSATFTFSTRGFYPYYCAYHGSDSGVAMSGVVWAQ
jgi:plastocyanin